MLNERIHFLQSVAPFSFLPEEEIVKASENLSLISYKKNTIICIQGHSRVEHLYIIQKGAAERYFDEKGRKLLSGKLGEGDIYGGISMLVNASTALRTLKTIEDSIFYIVPKETFYGLCWRFKNFSEYFSDTFGKRMINHSYSSIIRKTMQTRDESLYLFNQAVSTLYSRNLLWCNEDTTIKDAAIQMTDIRCSSIFIKSNDGRCKGIVTDFDLRTKVIVAGIDTADPISSIMTSPLKTISESSQIFEALMSMMKHNIKHIGVTDEDGSVVGVLSNRDLLVTQGQSPFFLIREISEASTVQAVTDKHERLPGMIHGMINSGAKAGNVNKLITMLSDTVLNKLIGFALEEIGPPPVKFVFMIMGSEGRSEQTLKTDQDNAIIYEDVPDELAESVNAFFLEFGQKVCTWLDEAGYTFCEGGIMAQNPKWCQPFSVWQEYFNSWIHAAEPEDLLHTSIFFDFRGAYGEMSLIENLHNFLFRSLKGWSGFFRNLTENALCFRPPLGFFRNFVVESKGKHQNMLDIKSAMTPIVDFARIYALSNEISETNTIERLKLLYVKQVLTWEEYSELEKAYSFLMQLRFVRQVTMVIEDGKPPINYINPKTLTNIEQTMLKEVFKRTEKFQSKLNFDFIGVF